MITFKGKVLTVEDRVGEFNDKDKDGNKLPTKSQKRITSIVLLVKDGSHLVPLVCKGFELPTTFVLPKEGEEWETPEIQSYQAKFKSVPECNIN